MTSNLKVCYDLLEFCFCRLKIFYQSFDYFTFRNTPIFNIGNDNLHLCNGPRVKRRVAGQGVRRRRGRQTGCVAMRWKRLFLGRQRLRHEFHELTRITEGTFLTAKEPGTPSIKGLG